MTVEMSTSTGSVNLIAVVSRLYCLIGQVWNLPLRLNHFVGAGSKPALILFQKQSITDIIRHVFLWITNSIKNYSQFCIGTRARLQTDENAAIRRTMIAIME